MTLRQGFEILGIPFEKVPEVNAALQPIIDELGINQGENGTGYPASGTRNVMACIGNRVCPFANYDTTALAKRIEKAIFPNDLHFKVALTGCPNDCGKVRMVFKVLQERDQRWRIRWLGSGRYPYDVFSIHAELNIVPRLQLPVAHESDRR